MASRLTLSMRNAIATEEKHENVREKVERGEENRVSAIAEYNEGQIDRPSRV